MPRSRKNKPASSPVSVQLSPVPEVPEIPEQLIFDTFISMPLPVCATFAMCRENYLAASRLAQSRFIDGECTPHLPKSTNTSSCSCSKEILDAPILTQTELHHEEEAQGQPINVPALVTHQVTLHPHSPQDPSSSNPLQPSVTLPPSSNGESWASRLRQQDPADSSPQLFQARPPHLALQPVGSNNHAARSIFVGDQAWPPIRPPITQSTAGTSEAAFSQVAPDIGVEAQRARDAFRVPQDDRSPEETEAAASACFASLMARAKTATSQPPHTTSQRPRVTEPSETAGETIVSEYYRDPEASVVDCEVRILPTPSSRPRSLSRREKNRLWHLNDPPVQSGEHQASVSTEGASGAVTCATPARPAAFLEDVDSGGGNLNRQVLEPEHDGIKLGGSEHGRCARSGAASTASGSTATTSEAAPRYHQPAAQGKGRDEVGMEGIMQGDSEVGDTTRDTAALLAEGLADNLGKKGSIAGERGEEEESSESPLSPVDSRGSDQASPNELDASAEMWRVTADVIVQTDGTPLRMLSCTVDTQWQETTVQTLPLPGSLRAGLSLTDDERLVRVLRILTREETVHCLEGARELCSLETKGPTRILCTVTRASSFYHLRCTEGHNGACTQTLRAQHSTTANSSLNQVTAGGARDSVIPGEINASDSTTWRMTADLIVTTDGALVRKLNQTVDASWSGTMVRTLPLRNSLLAGLSLTDSERLIRVLKVATRDETIHCLLSEQGPWPLDNKRQTQVLCVATWEDSLRHLRFAEGLDERCIRNLAASRLVYSSQSQATEYVARVRTHDSPLDRRELPQWIEWPAHEISSSHADQHPENETSSGDPPTGPDNWQEHPSLAMPERAGGTDIWDEGGKREALQHRWGQPRTARASSARAGESGSGKSSRAADAPSSLQGNAKVIPADDATKVTQSYVLTEICGWQDRSEVSAIHEHHRFWTASVAADMIGESQVSARIVDGPHSIPLPRSSVRSDQGHGWCVRLCLWGQSQHLLTACEALGTEVTVHDQDSFERLIDCVLWTLNHCSVVPQSALDKTWTGSKPSCPVKTSQRTRAAWTLHDYMGGVRPPAQTPLPHPVDPGAWRLAVLTERAKDEQKPLATVWQKLRQRRTDRQNSRASVQPPGSQETEEPFHAPRRARRQRSPPQPQPVPTPNPFEVLAELSDDSPAQSRLSQRGFQAPRRAALLSQRQEFAGPADRLARQTPKGPKARGKSMRGVGSDLLNMTVNGPVGTRMPLWDTRLQEDKQPSAQPKRRTPDGRRGASPASGAQRQASDGIGKVLPVTRPETAAAIGAELHFSPEFAGEDQGAQHQPAAGRPQVLAGAGTAERGGSSRVDKHFLRRTATGRPVSDGGGMKGRGTPSDTDHLDARHAVWPHVEKASRSPRASGTDKSGVTHHRSGTSPHIAIMPQNEHSSVTVRVREGPTWHAINIAQTDWQALQYSRFGASLDLVVSLRLRESLRRTDLERLTVLTAEELTLDRNSWPTRWEDFVSSVDKGIHFRVEPSERGGMDPTRQAELADLRFPADLDWPLLDQGYQLVRRQEALPESYPPVYRKRAELLAEATQLYQWERMASLPASNNHGECSPARMAALLVLLARKQGGRVRTPPPWVTEGAEGQIIELRFNSVPPPADLPTGGPPTDFLKDWLLIRLVGAFPALGTTLSRSAGNGVDYRWVRSKIRIDGDLDALQEFSMTAILPYGPWVSELVSRRVSIEGSYCTVAPFGTHIEVALAPEDNTIFRCIRLSLGLNSSDSLDLLEDGFSRAIPEGFISCRFTTVLSTASGGKGRRRTFSHFPPEDERAATLFTIGAENLLMARRRQLQVALRLGVDGQYPITLRVLLPPPPQRVLHMMLESLGTPPLRLRVRGALFVSDRVLLGPLPSGWLTGKVDFYSEVAQEQLRRQIATLFHAHLNTEGLQFVGRREPAKNRRTRSDPSPLFIYLEFPGVNEARAFGTKADDGSLPREFLAFWEAYIGTQPTVWSSMVLLEALEVVAPDKWAPLMERGEHSPCPLPPPSV